VEREDWLYDNPRRLLLDTCPDRNQLVDIGNEAYRILNSNPPGLAFAAGSTPLADRLPDDVADCSCGYLRRCAWWRKGLSWMDC